MDREVAAERSRAVVRRRQMRRRLLEVLWHHNHVHVVGQMMRSSQRLVRRLRRRRLLGQRLLRQRLLRQRLLSCGLACGMELQHGALGCLAGLLSSKRDMGTGVRPFMVALDERRGGRVHMKSHCAVQARQRAPAASEAGLS